MNTCPASVVVARPPPAVSGGSIPTVGLSKRDWVVRPCELAETQAAIRRWHYSRGGSNTAVYTFGLYCRYEWFGAHLWGTSWWLPPTKSAALSIDPNWNGVLALSRLACDPATPSNACSFLIRHSMRFIDRDRWPVLVSYADEWQKHTGIIYQASGWTFDGYTKPERTYLRGGRMVSRKRGPTTFTHAQMLASGCECAGKFRRLRFIHRLPSSRVSMPQGEGK